MDLIQIIVIVLVVCAPLLLGYICVRYGSNEIAKDRSIKNTGISTQATSVELKWWRINRSRVFVVEYMTETGIIRANTTYPRITAVGQTYTIFYDQNKPKNFCFENDKRTIYSGRFFIFLGITFFVESIWLVFFIFT